MNQNQQNKPEPISNLASSSINQLQKASISMDKHQSELIWINRHQSVLISIRMRYEVGNNFFWVIVVLTLLRCCSLSLQTPAPDRVNKLTLIDANWFRLILINAFRCLLMLIEINTDCNSIRISQNQTELTSIKQHWFNQHESTTFSINQHQ